MKKYFIFLILLCLFPVSFIYAGSITATGFIPGQIWYSKDTIVEGDTIKIYTAVWNSADSPLSAKVEFYDQNVILGTRDIIVAPQELKEASVSWKVTAGDHVMTAKIISPSVTVSGKKQPVVLENSSTESSRKFVSVVIKTINGDPAKSSDIIQNQLDKATSSLGDILPESVSAPMSKNLGLVSGFREDTLADISKMKEETKKTIDELSKIEETTTNKNNTKVSADKKGGVEDATKKPIAYVKLFFLTILSFIFGSNLVFYALIALLLFLVIKWIYFKIKNR